MVLWIFCSSRNYFKFAIEFMPVCECSLCRHSRAKLKYFLRQNIIDEINSSPILEFWYTSSQNIPTYICTVRPTYFSTYAYFLPQLFYKKIATDRKKEKSFDSRYIFVVLKSFKNWLQASLSILTYNLKMIIS